MLQSNIFRWNVGVFPMKIEGVKRRGRKDADFGGSGKGYL